MTILEDAVREKLRAEAQALRVPERPPLDRDIAELRRHPGPRWLVAAACVGLVAAGIVAVALRRAGDTEPAPPAASVVPDATAPAAPATTAPATSTTVGSEPASISPSNFLGTWITTDVFGGSSTMTVEAAEDDSVEIRATDFASVCSGTSTMIGTGRLQTDTELVFPAPTLTCDDGSQPQSLSNSPLDEDLQNLTFTRDAVTDILTDNLGAVWTREGADPSLEPTAPPVEAAVTELLNGFIEARLAGDGAQQFLNVPDEEVPLLYATTTGATYERAEFEPATGVEWPYGFTAFKVRLFAGDTVVEQLFFIPAAGRLGLEYQPDGFGTDIAPTAEDGRPVAVPRDFFDGEVTMQVGHPWIFSGDSGIFGFGRLIPEGPDVRPTTDGGERNDWDEVFLLADPAPVGTACPLGPSPDDAKALAESLRSNPDFGATAPVAVNVGGVEALMMDVAIPAGTAICTSEAFDGDLGDLVFDDLAPSSYGGGIATGRATGESMRLYLFDAPEGSSMQTLAVAIVAPTPRLERAAQAAAPLVDSVEFHAP